MYGGEVRQHPSSLMCLQSPEGSSHFDTIAATSFVNFPRRSHVNEGEAHSSSMLREAPSFVVVWISHYISRFWLGLFISVKIKNVWTLQQTIFYFTLHGFDGDKWTFIYWFSAINQCTENLKFTRTEFLNYEILVQGFIGPF
jgi:hypothetical protein